MTRPTKLYKILTPEQWPMSPSGFPTEIDAKDGFIHLSQGRQVISVANRFFRSNTTLIILMIPVENLKDQDVRWEAPVHPSLDHLAETEKEPLDEAFKADQVFPHLYTKQLKKDWIEKVIEVNKNEDGEFDFELEW